MQTNVSLTQNTCISDPSPQVRLNSEPVLLYFLECVVEAGWMNMARTPTREEQIQRASEVGALIKKRFETISNDDISPVCLLRKFVALRSAYSASRSEGSVALQSALQKAFADEPGQTSRKKAVMTLSLALQLFSLRCSPEVITLFQAGQHDQAYQTMASRLDLHPDSIFTPADCREQFDEWMRKKDDPSFVYYDQIQRVCAFGPTADPQPSLPSCHSEEGGWSHAANVALFELIFKRAEEEGTYAINDATLTGFRQKLWSRFADWTYTENDINVHFNELLMQRRKKNQPLVQEIEAYFVGIKNEETAAQRRLVEEKKRKKKPRATARWTVPLVISLLEMVQLPNHFPTILDVSYDKFFGRLHPKFAALHPESDITPSQMKSKFTTLMKAAWELKKKHKKNVSEVEQAMLDCLAQVHALRESRGPVLQPAADETDDEEEEGSEDENEISLSHHSGDAFSTSTTTTTSHKRARMEGSSWMDHRAHPTSPPDNISFLSDLVACCERNLSVIGQGDSIQKLLFSSIVDHLRVCCEVRVEKKPETITRVQQLEERLDGLREAVRHTHMHHPAS